MNEIDPNIVGYDLVKDCVAAYGEERTLCHYLFAVSRNKLKGNHRDEDKAYLNAICEVRPNTSQNYDEMHQKFDFDNYIIWHGMIWDSKRYGGKVIVFYWS